MIHSVSVSNYHSIRDEVVLDLRIPGTAPDLPCFRRSAARPEIRLPAVVVLMGPNGSGKTTLLRALVAAAEFASSLPLAGEPAIKGFVPFMSKSVLGVPTRFCIDFEVNGLLPGENSQLFRYEVVVERSETTLVPVAMIRHEALLHFP